MEPTEKCELVTAKGILMLNSRANTIAGNLSSSEYRWSH